LDSERQQEKDGARHHSENKPKQPGLRAAGQAQGGELDSGRSGKDRSINLHHGPFFETTPSIPHEISGVGSNLAAPDREFIEA
jgi:hypothetical protein